MENASKALIIAGAILISILLIAISMYIYKSAQGTIQTAAGQMGQQDKQMYNATIEKYIGQSKKGTEVKQMIEEIISNNNQYVNETGKFIAIKPTSVAGFATTGEGLEGIKNGVIGYDADAYNGEGCENNQKNIDAASKKMRELSQKIIAGKNYIVSAEGGTDDGIIHEVEITPTDVPSTTP